MTCIQSLNLYLKYRNVKGLISILLISICNIHELKNILTNIILFKIYKFTIHNKFSKNIFNKSTKLYKAQKTIC